MTGTQTTDMENDVTTVPVDLGDRSYDILIGRGVLSKAADRIAALGARKALIVTDDNVSVLHGASAERVLKDADLALGETFSVRPGEASKSYSVLEQLCDGALAAKLERKDLIVALGGGVVGDLAGFAAAIVRRGLRFVQIPTSLLAQVDSSVGGKTGINSPHGKNLIGAFHQPSLVLADTALVDTLDPREAKAGYAEIVKYGLIDDETFFNWCEANWGGLLAGGSERDFAVAQSCRAKAAVVGRDEREEGERALLNLGHTFGHALERATAYDSKRLVHGEGVAIGMALAYRFSVRLGLCHGQDASRVTRHLQAVGLPTRLQDVPGGYGSSDTLMDAMVQDKKVKNGALTFILARGIGQSFVANGVPADDVHEFLKAEISEAT